MKNLTILIAVVFFFLPMVDTGAAGQSRINLVSELLGPDWEAYRERSPINHGFRQGSTDEHWRLTEEERFLSLEGNVLNLVNTFDRLLEEFGKRSKGGVDFPHYIPSMEPPAPPTLPAPDYGYSPQFSAPYYCYPQYQQYPTPPQPFATSSSTWSPQPYSPPPPSYNCNPLPYAELLSLPPTWNHQQQWQNPSAPPLQQWLTMSLQYPQHYTAPPTYLQQPYQYPQQQYPMSPQPYVNSSSSTWNQQPSSCSPPTDLYNCYQPPQLYSTPLPPPQYTTQLTPLSGYHHPPQISSQQQQYQFAPYVYDEMPARREAHRCLDSEDSVFDEMQGIQMQLSIEDLNPGKHQPLVADNMSIEPVNLSDTVSSKHEATVARQIQEQFQTSGKRSLQEALKPSLELSVVPTFVRTGNTKALNPVGMHQSNRPTAGIPEMVLSIQQMEMLLDPKMELSRFIFEHKFGEAFTMALQQGDVSIFSWLYSRGELHAIFSMVPLPLNQRILLSSKFSGLFAMKTDSSIVMIRLEGEGELEVIDKIQHSVSVSNAISRSGEQVFAIVHDEESEIITVKLDNNLSNVLRKTVKIDSQSGNVAKEGVTVVKGEHNLFEWLNGHLVKLKGTLILVIPDNLAAVLGMRLKSSETIKMMAWDPGIPIHWVFTSTPATTTTSTLPSALTSFMHTIFMVQFQIILPPGTNIPNAYAMDRGWMGPNYSICLSPCSGEEREMVWDPGIKL
ncbi:enhancer of mRNA-decapping protein 4-like [Iris pallida]|uniref:Enhancer of mRNA-decapping protein 4-like n=1 Tax=Iris pallida TaxID=29817 RepID=A0AAX6HTF7_IRIPA|nr:enhancer of mRNA-decapping protein 4-like [Iris pallida]